MIHSSQKIASPPLPVLNGEHLRLGIVVSRYNWEITGAMLSLAQKECRDHGVADQDITIQFVPGAFEIPIVAQALLARSSVDAILCLGCVMKGETRHDILIGDTVAQALQQLSLEHHIPVIFGIQCAETREQAYARIGRAGETACTMIEMVCTLQQIQKGF